MFLTLKLLLRPLVGISSFSAAGLWWLSAKMQFLLQNTSNIPAKNIHLLMNLGAKENIYAAIAAGIAAFLEAILEIANSQNFTKHRYRD